MAVNTAVSCFIAPFTELTRLGMRSRRLWYWVSTWAHWPSTASEEEMRPLYEMPAHPRMSTTATMMAIVLFFICIDNYILYRAEDEERKEAEGDGGIEDVGRCDEEARKAEDYVEEKGDDAEAL